MESPGRFLVYLSGVVFYLSILFFTTVVSGDELTDRDVFWRKASFLCSAVSPAFPSKELLGQPNECEDGDMTLFNGLLCAAGEAIGCDAVARSQGADGRWWRSPRRVGWEAPVHDVSFSPDQSLGVLLYAIHTDDKIRFSAWLKWIETHRPCLVKIGSICVKYGWVRFCLDDPDKRCTLRPADCVRIEAVANRLGVDGKVCRRVLQDLGMSDGALLPLGDFLLAAAAVNDPGFPQNLVGVDILLARSVGVDADKVNQAANVLYARTSNNPFFKYLSAGASPALAAEVMSTCPSPDRPSNNRFQWTWERVMKSNSWIESMYWECIFLGDLIRS